MTHTAKIIKEYFKIVKCEVSLLISSFNIVFSALLFSVRLNTLTFTGPPGEHHAIEFSTVIQMF